MIAIVVAGFVTSCSKGGTVTETHVGRAELYRIDNVKYDEFFEDVNGLQKDSKAAADDEKSARAPLQKALGLADTTAETLADLVRDEVRKLAQGKPKRKIAFEGLDEAGTPVLGQPITVTPAAAKRKPWPKDAREFAAALEETARSEGQLMDKYGPLADKARRRLEMTEKLSASVDEDLGSLKSDQRKEVRQELAAAHTVLAQIAQDCDRVNTTATTFLRRSAEAVAAVSDAKPAPKGGPKADPKPAKKPR